MKKLRLTRPSPSMVVALLALAVALGGTSYAAVTVTGKNVRNGSLTGKDVRNSSLSGTDVRNSSIASKDVKNSSLTGGDVRNGSLGEADIKGDSLTGASLNESTLGKVPLASNADNAGHSDDATHADSADNATDATNAGNATTVNGQHIVPFVYQSDATATRSPVADAGGVFLEGACSTGDNDLFLVNKTGLSAEITWTGVDDAAGVSGGSRNLTVSNNNDANIASITPDDGTTAQAGFLNTDGKVARVLYTMNEDSQGFDCSISGYLIG